MSSQLPSAGPSPQPDPYGGDPPGEVSVAARARFRGAPLIDALEDHLPGSREHADACGTYAFAAAVELGCDRKRAELVREVARLHDVGMVYVPPELATREPAALADDERAQIEAHHEAGFRLVRGAGVPDPVCEAVLAFRERFDGSGPEGIAADAIPLEARIARAGCACHLALAAEPPVGTSGGERRSAAVADLRARSGSELDPRVVDAITGLLERMATR